MVEKIRLGEQWYILATSSPADERRRVLKHHDIFAMFDRFGDIQPIGLGEEGIYHGDTCFLSHHELQIEGVRPMFLNSTVRDDNGLFVVELMNPDLHPEGGNRIAKGDLHVFRAKLLWNNACYEHVRIVNYGLEPIEVTLSMEFGADYKDIFEVRGFHREQRGKMLEAEVSNQELLLGYRGLDNVVRKTRITLDPPPEKLTASRVDYRVALAPKGEAHYYVTVHCEHDGEPARSDTDYFAAFTKMNRSVGERLQNRWLDGNKQQCAVRSSNAGHTLWSGIATPEYAARIAAQLLSEEFFCGWGIRTIPLNEARYNPMAYHNGSVWPHDNALIADGMARYGFTGKAMHVFSALREACLYMDQSRMPELFCGFEKRPDEGPTLYPVACSPQAWAAATVFSLLQSCLGLSFDPHKPEIRFRHPQLPPFLERVEIRGLSIAGSTVDLLLQRYPNNVGVNVIRKQGPAEVVVVA